MNNMKLKVKQFCKTSLKLISSGKYQTVMYNEKTGDSFSSSVVGGLVTLLLGILIGVVVIQQLV